MEKEKYTPDRTRIPTTFGEVTLCLDRLLMEDAIFGNAITTDVDRLLRKFVSEVMKENKGELPEASYRLTGYTLELAERIWKYTSSSRPTSV